MQSRVWRFGAAILPFLLLYICVVLIPFVGIIQKSFVTSRTIEIELFRPSKLRSSSFTLSNYIGIFREKYYVQSLSNTLSVISLSTLITVLIGTIVSYALVWVNFPGKRLIERVFSFPLFLSAVVACYGLFICFSRYGLVAALSEFLLGKHVALTRTVYAIVVGTIYILMPMFVQLVKPGFESVDAGLFEASFSLGASELYTFWKVALPIAFPAVIAGTIIVFTYAMGLVVVALILGPPSARFSMLPVEVFEKARGLDLNIPLASAIGVVLAVVSILGQRVAERILAKVGSK
ncbi:MAG: ABC transporter permease subunit [Candidatus Methanomethyliaceae archaeon]